MNYNPETSISTFPWTCTFGESEFKINFCGFAVINCQEDLNDERRMGFVPEAWNEGSEGINLGPPAETLQFRGT